MAVILAATNAGYREKGLMVARREQGPDGRLVEVQVFTPEGVERFLADIDARFPSGKDFCLEPNVVARGHGLKSKRYIFKR